MNDRFKIFSSQWNSMRWFCSWIQMKRWKLFFLLWCDEFDLDSYTRKRHHWSLALVLLPQSFTVWKKKTQTAHPFDLTHQTHKLLSNLSFLSPSQPAQYYVWSFHVNINWYLWGKFHPVMSILQSTDIHQPRHTQYPWGVKATGRPWFVCLSVWLSQKSWHCKSRR